MKNKNQTHLQAKMKPMSYKIFKLKDNQKTKQGKTLEIKVECQLRAEVKKYLKTRKIQKVQILLNFTKFENNNPNKV